MNELNQLKAEIAALKQGQLNESKQRIVSGKVEAAYADAPAPLKRLAVNELSKGDLSDASVTAFFESDDIQELMQPQQSAAPVPDELRPIADMSQRPRLSEMMADLKSGKAQMKY